MRVALVLATLALAASTAASSVGAAPASGHRTFAYALDRAALDPTPPPAGCVAPQGSHGCASVTVPDGTRVTITVHDEANPFVFGYWYGQDASGARCTPDEYFGASTTLVTAAGCDTIWMDTWSLFLAPTVGTIAVDWAPAGP